MEKFLLLGGEVAAVTAAILAGYVTLLCYRAPRHTKWLESNAAITAVMIFFMAALIFSFGWLVKGIYAIAPDPMTAVGAALGYAILAAWVFWKAMRMPARLRAADAGRSPFRLSAHKPRRRRAA